MDQQRGVLASTTTSMQVGAKVTRRRPDSPPASRRPRSTSLTAACASGLLESARPHPQRLVHLHQGSDDRRSRDSRNDRCRASYTALITARAERARTAARADGGECYAGATDVAATIWSRTDWSGSGGRRRSAAADPGERLLDVLALDDGLWQAAIVVMSRFCERSTYRRTSPGRPSPATG